MPSQLPRETARSIHPPIAEVQSRINSVQMLLDALKLELKSWHDRAKGYSDMEIVVRSRNLHDRCHLLLEQIVALEEEAAAAGVDHVKRRSLAEARDYLRIQTAFTPEQLQTALVRSRSGQTHTVEEVRRGLRN